MTTRLYLISGPADVSVRFVRFNLETWGDVLLDFASSGRQYFAIKTTLKPVTVLLSLRPAGFAVVDSIAA
jgi:hypothetical protein